MLKFIRWDSAANTAPKDHFDQLKIRTTSSKISMIKVITLMKSSRREPKDKSLSFSHSVSLLQKEASFIGSKESGDFIYIIRSM